MKILSIRNYRSDLVFSGILKLQQLEGLRLRGQRRFQSNIPRLSQLNNLRSLDLYLPNNRHIFGSFFASLKNFQKLTKLELYWPFSWRTSARRIDIEDSHLMELKHLPLLTELTIDTAGMRYMRYTNITLPGILNVLKNCPKLKRFQISGFRQNYAPDESFLYDADIYKKFVKILNEEECKHRWKKFIDMREMGSFKWYKLHDWYNMINVFKRCLK